MWEPGEMTGVVSGGSWEVVRTCLPIPFESILPSVKQLFCLVEKTTINLVVLPKLSLLISHASRCQVVVYPFLSPRGHASLMVGLAWAPRPDVRACACHVPLPALACSGFFWKSEPS